MVWQPWGMGIYGPSPQDEGVMDGAWGWGDMGR